MTLLTLLLTGLLGCASPPCEERDGDDDCDGVPDADDACSQTLAGALTDRRGCSGEQAAGCSVALDFPEDGARDDDERFGWSGDCPVYALQLSEQPDFPPGATRTAYRGAAQEVRVAPVTESWWRVVGGQPGRNAEFATEARALR